MPNSLLMPPPPMRQHPNHHRSNRQPGLCNRYIPRPRLRRTQKAKIHLRKRLLDILRPRTARPPPKILPRFPNPVSDGRGYPDGEMGAPFEYRDCGSGGVVDFVCGFDADAVGEEGDG